MAHSKQAEKRNRQNAAARERNKASRSAMKTAMKRVLRAKDTESAKAGLSVAMRRVDKAAKTGVIHKNAAARYKSQLSRATSART